MGGFQLCHIRPVSLIANHGGSSIGITQSIITIYALITCPGAPAPNSSLDLPGLCLHKVTVHCVDVFRVAFSTCPVINPHRGGIADYAYVSFF